MINDEILSLLVNHDWQTTIPNLLIHAQGRLKGKTVPGSFTANDYVQDAYERVHNGDRNWDPVKDPDLLTYLESVIDSLISASIKSRYNNLSEIDLNMFDPQSSEDIFGSLIASELYDCIVDKIKDDMDLQLLFCCITDYGKTKPQEIAEELGWEISKVNNLKKKLKRIVFKILEPTVVN